LDVSSLNLAVLQGIATFLWAGKTPLPAARRGDAVIGWAAATQLIWSLRDGRQRQVSVRILIVHDDLGLTREPTRYPSLPDMRRYPRCNQSHDRTNLDAAHGGCAERQASRWFAHPQRG